jgi:hypothetical protein
VELTLGDGLGARDVLIDAGPLKGGLPSTIVGRDGRSAGARKSGRGSVGPRAKISSLRTSEPTERAALVGLALRRATRANAEHSLDELSRSGGRRLAPLWS